MDSQDGRDGTSVALPAAVAIGVQAGFFLYTNSGIRNTREKIRESRETGVSGRRHALRLRQRAGCELKSYVQ